MRRWTEETLYWHLRRVEVWIAVRQVLRAHKTHEQREKARAKQADAGRVSRLNRDASINARNKRRVQLRGSYEPVPRGWWRKQMREQGYACGVCGVLLRDGGVVEHVMPLSRGGNHSPHNTWLTCGPCNVWKANKHPLYFLVAAAARGARFEHNERK